MSLVGITEIIRTDANITLQAISGKVQRVINTSATNSITVTPEGGTSFEMSAKLYCDCFYDEGVWYTDRDSYKVSELAEYDNYIKLNESAIGEIKFLDDYQEPSADHPWFPIVKTDEVLLSSNWPDLVGYWRNKPLRYMPGIDNKTEFTIESWSITSNVATLTFADTTGEKAVLAALEEDSLVHGSFTDWRTVTLGTAVGDITAGTYSITAIDSTARTLSFTFTAADNSSTGTWNVTFHPHRLSDSDDSDGTRARHFQVAGRGFFTTNDIEGLWIGGLRRRDQLLNHSHEFWSRTSGADHGSTRDTIKNDINVSLRTYDERHVRDVTDMSGNPTRSGEITHGPGLSVFAYIYGKSYIS